MIYIFLDIDGVLNNNSNQSYYGMDVDPINLHHFNNFLEELKKINLDFKIIVTSDWKDYPKDLDFLFNSFINEFYTDTTKIENIEKPIDKVRRREFEIKKYLEKIKDLDFKYIIIDDFPLEFDNLIKTNYDTGFLLEHKELCLKKIIL